MSIAIVEFDISEDKQLIIVGLTPFFTQVIFNAIEK